MSEIGAVAVYCGSNPGSDPAFRDAAQQMGTEIARRGLLLVYGGGSVGLMGVVADAALAAGGQVHGVITHGLKEREVDHKGLTQLDVVDTMHARKKRMCQLADAVVMMPGGVGTLDEFFEAVTWTQLGIHNAPCGVLEVGTYFDPLMAMLESACEQGFLPAHQRSIILRHRAPRGLLEAMASWERPSLHKWLEIDEA